MEVSYSPLQMTVFKLYSLVIGLAFLTAYGAALLAIVLPIMVLELAVGWSSSVPLDIPT